MRRLDETPRDTLSAVSGIRICSLTCVRFLLGYTGRRGLANEIDP